MLAKQYHLIVLKGLASEPDQNKKKKLFLKKKEIYILSVMIRQPKTLLVMATHASALFKDSSMFDELPSKLKKYIKRYRLMSSIICGECLELSFNKINADGDKTFWETMDILYDEFYHRHDEFCPKCFDVLTSVQSAASVTYRINVLSTLLKDSTYWHKAHDTMEQSCVFWDVRNLSLTQALMLKNIPDEDFWEEELRLVCLSYRTVSDDRLLCSHCIKLECTKHVLVTNSFEVVSSENYILDYLQSESMWCSACLYRPLFTPIYEDEHYYCVDAIYSNSSDSCWGEFPTF